ncbi:MAG: stage IV sporulation protein A [Clostridia bacterium]|nr:stage IV sporulation protein A [Clostridia bacterium]
MNPSTVYDEIAVRTGGNIYIGVVGPVRTGKSTFIKRFLETVVLPGIPESYDRERARDEMPQSAAGKTVMTTEPKFIPDNGVEIETAGKMRLSVKLVDCVGYIVPDALGQTENGKPRMVMTPWSTTPLPFGEAAEMGTRKVITDHSTIGVLVTTDGSVTELPRQGYEEAERRVAAELTALGKPFVVVLNSAHPDDPASEALALELEARYNAPVALVSCQTLDADDILHILELVLHQFPLREVGVKLPDWVSVLEPDHPVRRGIQEALLSAAAKISRVGQAKEVFSTLAEADYIERAELRGLDLGIGRAELELTPPPALYYQVLSGWTGLSIADQRELITTVRNLAGIKRRYDKIAGALAAAEATGYGIVEPDVTEMRLEEPKIVHHSGGYGVKLKASAPSLHLIRTSIETEISPVVGTQQQSEDLIKYLLSEFEENPASIWSTNLFGKTLYELVNEGIHQKLAAMPEDARLKLADTISRIINEGSTGLICILL